MNLSEELVGDGGFDEEEENQIQIYWRAGNTMVIKIKMVTLVTLMTDSDLLDYVIMIVVVTPMTIMTDSDLLEGRLHHGEYDRWGW